jgi:acetyl-CoA acetyltransferase
LYGFATSRAPKLHGYWISIVHVQGMCAEKCVSDFGFTRKELDDFAILSYTRAAAAWKVCDCTA